MAPFYRSAIHLLTRETAAAKGLVAGNFILRRADGTSVNGLSETEVRTLARMSQSKLT